MGHRKGVTLVELMVYMAVMSIAIAAFAGYFGGFMKSAKSAEHKMQASAELRLLFSRLSDGLHPAVAFTGVSASSVTIICGSEEAPWYAPDGDTDGDGVPNLRDTDDDGDAAQRFSLPADQQWRVGYDLEDDDDDNDGNLDCLLSFYYVPAERAVYRSARFNAGPPEIKLLAVNISSFSFTAYGSRREDLGRNIDLGNDGMPGTSDAGEGDGIISAREIDWVRPAQGGHGNRSGAIDTADELKYVTTLELYAECDYNSDGTPDSFLRTHVSPPLVPLRRRR
jgi:type II secretory pathway pseudopilin PulG